ncbi:hypothetical protein J6590_076009 [Homalodisca vitripennis]|nr:hypothetical protein J6590_076009 [Homalodisca vitripennis]
MNTLITLLIQGKYVDRGRTRPPLTDQDFSMDSEGTGCVRNGGTGIVGMKWRSRYWIELGSTGRGLGGDCASKPRSLVLASPCQ